MNQMMALASEADASAQAYYGRYFFMEYFGGIVFGGRCQLVVIVTSYKQ
jgi:hypothetical protein